MTAELLTDRDFSERRFVYVFIPYEMLPDLLSGRSYWKIRDDEIPKDIEIVSVHMEPARRSFGLLLSSSAFFPVPVGGMIPFREVEFEAREAPSS